MFNPQYQESDRSHKRQILLRSRVECALDSRFLNPARQQVGKLRPRGHAASGNPLGWWRVSSGATTTPDRCSLTR